MKNKMYMTLKNVIEKRLERKKAQLAEIETTAELTSAIDKRKFIETKAVIQELENVLDLAVSIFETETENE